MEINLGNLKIPTDSFVQDTASKKVDVDESTNNSANDSNSSVDDNSTSNASAKLEFPLSFKSEDNEENNQQAADNADSTDNNDNEEVSLFNKIKQEYSLDKDYAETIEGLDNILSDISTSPKLKEKILEEFYNENPVIKEYADHLSKGYGRDSFEAMLNATDYNSIQLNEDSVDNNKEIYKIALKAQKINQEDIDDLIQTAEDKGNSYLHKKAESSKEFLSKLQADTINKMALAEKQEKEKIDKEIEQEWKTVKSTIDAGSLTEFNISKDDQKKLHDYISKPVKNGRTQRELDRESLSIERQLLIDLLIMNNFKLPNKKVITSQQQDRSKITLQDLLKKDNNKKKADFSGGNNSGSFSEENDITKLKSLLSRKL